MENVEQLQSQLIAKFDELVKNSANVSEAKLEKQLKEVETGLNKLANENKEKANEAFAKISEMATSIKEQGEAINSLLTKRIGSEDEFAAELKKALPEIKNQIEANKSGYTKIGVALVHKDAVNMITADVITGQIPQAQRLPGVNIIPQQKFWIRANADTMPTQSRIIEWVEEHTDAGSAAQTAEGETKSQISMMYRVGDATVRKITAFIKVTKEMIDDIPWLMAQIRGKLTYKIEKQEESQLWSGNGLVENLNGLTKYAQTVDNAALAGAIQSPSRWDVLLAAISQIRENSEGDFDPNIAVMRPIDKTIMITGKSSTGENLTPAYVDQLGQSVDGVRTLTSTVIPAGYFFVGDMSRFHVAERSGVEISIGLDGNDFTKNFVTILAEKRLASFVEANDTEAFVYDSFANAIAFIGNGS